MTDEKQSSLFDEISAHVAKAPVEDKQLIDHDAVAVEASEAIRQTYSEFVSKKIKNEKQLENFQKMLKNFCIELATKRSFNTRKSYTYKNEETRKKAQEKGKKMAEDLHGKPKPATDDLQVEKKSYRPKKAARRPGTAK